jgi:hypothetical protein
MASGFDTVKVNGGGNAVAAVLFVGSVNNAIDIFSATNSSPWTAENFGGDPEKVASLREYVLHAVILTGTINVIGAAVAHSLWPLIGAAMACAYMYWLYERAVKRGMNSGSTDWENSGGSDSLSQTPGY